MKTLICLCAALLLAGFDGWIVLLESLDELGVIGLVTAVLFEQEFHIVKEG